MNIEFDSAKDKANIARHGVSLGMASAMDFDTALVVEDARKSYGEVRYQAAGMIGGRLHVLVFTMRGDNLRAISLRKANKREVARYEKT